MNRRTIIGKSIIRLVILAIVILVTVTLINGFYFYNKMLDEYHNFSEAFIEIISSDINKELIPVMIDNRDAINQYNSDNELYLEWSKTDMLIAQIVNLNEHIESFQVIIPDGDEAICLWYESSEPMQDDTFLIHTRKLDDFEETNISILYAMDNDNLDEYEPYMIINSADARLVGSLITPLYDNDYNINAIARLDLNLQDILMSILQLTLTITVIVLFIISFALEIYFFFSKREIMKPIVLLEQATDNIVERIQSNEEVIKLNIDTGDEIEALSHSFESMEENLRTYISENNKITAEKEHIKAELNLAANIQSDMLIKEFPAFPQREEFDIYASMTPAKEVGGDFYDFFMIDDNTLALVIADVSGKGVPAALFMMRTMLMIETLATSIKSPSDILYNLNNKMCENNQSKMFVTVWIGILDISTGVLRAANGGHEFPIIKGDTVFELYKDKHSLVIGAMQNMKFKEYEITLKKGNIVFLYTDGLVEAKNLSGAMFGTDAVVEALNKADDSDVSHIIDNMTESVNDFVKGAEQFDDLTMMCLRYN